MDKDKMAQDFQDYMLGVFPTPSVWLERGEGVHVWDSDGNKYLDFLAGIAVCSTGHCHNKVTSSLAGQVATLMHCSNLYGIPNEVELARDLCMRTGYGKAFFCNSGAEANEASIKLARKWAHEQGKQHVDIITAQNSFHGRTLVTVTATGQPKYQKGFGPRPAGFHYAPLNDIEALKEAVGPKTAAVMLEPIQGEGGVKPARDDYLRTARDLCDDHGALLIFDEIQTGMGRTGKFFAHEHAGVRPDIVTLAKALGSGFPVGAMLSTNEVAKVFGPGDHGSTFGGNPMACAAALATLEVMDEEHLIDNAREMGDYLFMGLSRLQEGAGMGIIKEVRGKGLLIGVELASNVAIKLKEEAQARGLLIGNIGKNVLRIAPPLIIDTSHVDEALDILGQACKAL
ncbi:acetylornithine transaminase [archaeon]|nr:MAG: acetylornithine transaminase [archaeon]